MGADWYFTKVFYGISFPDLEEFKELFNKYRTHYSLIGTPFTFYLIMTHTHSRAEGEEVSELLERCVGVIGMELEDGYYDLEELIKKKEELINILVEMGLRIDCPGLIGGIEKSIDYLFD